jgi:O-antigen/teichoic acid export membrane protein
MLPLFASPLKYLLKTSFFKDATLLVVLQIVSQTNNFIATYFVARFLGPANMGLISFTQTYIVFTFFINSGLDSYYMWQLANSRENKSSIFSRCFTTRIFINTISLVIGLFGVYFFSNSFFEALILTCSLFIGFFVYSIGFSSSFLLTEKRVKEYVIIAILTSFTIFALRAIFVYIEAPVYYFIFTLLSETLIIVGYGSLLHILHLRSIYFLKKEWIKKSIQEFFSAISHIGTVLSSLIFSRVDQFFIKANLSPHDLGLYTSSVRLVEYPMIISSLLTTLIIPRISASNEPKHRTRIAIFSTTLYIVIALSIVVVYLVWSNQIVKFVYGQSFMEAVPIFSIYTLIIPGLWLHNSMSIILAAYNKMHISFILCSVAGLLSILFLSNLITHFGVYGAAYSAVFIQNSLGIASFFTVLYFHLKTRLHNNT